MASRKVDVLVLADEAAPTGEGQVFPGFPGVYHVGEPVALDDLGLNQKEARALIKDLHLPLELDKAVVEKPDEPPVAGRHYDKGELDPGDDIPILTPAARIAAAPEGLAIPAGEDPPPSATAPPPEPEAVRAAAEVQTEEQPA